MSTDRDAGGQTAENVAAYGSGEAVDSYSKFAVEDGLHAAEESVVDRYFDADDGPVLDVGCGAGRTTAALHDRGFDVTGVDVSPSMVREAKRQFPELDVQQADATDLAFRDDAFEYVLFSYCGLDLVYPESARLDALREIRRVLEPGGVFAFSTHNNWYNLPAVLDDWNHIRKYYVADGNLARIGDPYKVDGTEWGMKIFVTNPRRQRQQLREFGFEPVAFVGKQRWPLSYLERRPYYVARNPE